MEAMKESLHEAIAAATQQERERSKVMGEGLGEGLVGVGFISDSEGIVLGEEGGCKCVCSGARVCTLVQGGVYSGACVV